MSCFKYLFSFNYVFYIFLWRVYYVVGWAFVRCWVFLNSFTLYTLLNVCFFKKYKLFNYVRYFVGLFCVLNMACRRFDNDVIEVLKVKVYFCDVDKSIFK